MQYLTAVKFNSSCALPYILLLALNGKQVFQFSLNRRSRFRFLFSYGAKHFFN